MNKGKEDIRRPKKALEVLRRLKKALEAERKLYIIFFLLFGLLLPSAALSKDYDGIWFIGFNLNKELFKDQEVREAVNATVNKDAIVKNIISGEVTPVSVIPPGMLGYDPDLEPTLRDVAFAKLLMKKAGYPMNDKRIKGLSLLHTDGLKTIKIAKQVQNDLRGIGMKVDLVEVSYAEEGKWVKELTSGKHDFFLLGYKAGVEKLFTSEAEATDIDSASLVEPLFETDGDVNFTGYSNSEVDKLLDQVSGFKLALKSERHNKLKKINQLVHKDLPVVVLFYIEKL